MSKLFTISLEPSKFHELVVHSAHLMADDPTASLIRINKILYYSDFAAYRELGRPITGACYRKYHEGPAPDYMPICLDKLAASTRAHQETYHHVLGDFNILKADPSRPADLSIFTPEELHYVNQAAQYLTGKTPTEVITLSSMEAGWLEAEYFDHIPYEKAWSSRMIPDQMADMACIKFFNEVPVSLQTW